MNTGLFKKLALALTWLALHMSLLEAQVFTNDLPFQANTTGTNPVDFEFRADGTLIATGNFGVGTLGTADQGDGTRMLWFPSLGAFRAGTVSAGLSIGSGPWDSSNIGQNSSALGYNTTASGSNSLAAGNGSVASGPAAIALGVWCTSTDQGTVALGSATTATGSNSFAAGFYSAAIGANSAVLGAFDLAYGAQATAIGASTTAIGENSTSMGSTTTASGYDSTSAGSHTTAAAQLSFVIGTYNIGGGDPTTWTPTDPLFEIGNGTASAPSDALIVYKSGNAVLQGTLEVAPGGDIPMYTGE